jgi:hypothetical protein
MLLKVHVNEYSNMTAASAGLFALQALDTPESIGTLHAKKALADIQPRFILPSLDEFASGEERLLAGMGKPPRYDLSSFDDATPAVPDEGERIVLREDPQEEDTALDTLWTRAFEDEAGPSKPKVFQVRTQLQTVTDLADDSH